MMFDVGKDKERSGEEKEARTRADLFHCFHVTPSQNQNTEYKNPRPFLPVPSQSRKNARSEKKNTKKEEEVKEEEEKDK